MITIRFFEGNAGFEFSGHSGYAEEGSDIVCASVSSAAYMAANTLIEVIGAKTQAQVGDGFMRVRVEETSPETDIVIKGLRLHLSELALQYPHYIVITKT